MVGREGEMGAVGEEERIVVSVRLRPLNGREGERGDGSDWECAGPTTLAFRGTVPERAMFPTTYTYDRVFSPECNTRQVYEEGAKAVALSVVSGINSSIFAYGQTSSGKTYTMLGITEYGVFDIYNYIEKHPEREFILKFSAMEIYNEAVRDLLSHDATPLRLLDDPEKGTVVEKLIEETLTDHSHLRELLAVCEAQRQIGETALNETSSRSHQILRLTIESSARQFLGRGNSGTLMACVNFVDLAGSERASQTASAGMRLKEGSHINRSLLTLGKVIRQLSKGRNGHIPYRDSKLTRILQSSLGGNARTAIICTMSPARCHIEQSRNTLLFANCAKDVVTNAQVNVVMSDKALVKHLQRELARLEHEMQFPGSASCATHAKALREKDEQIKKLEEQLAALMEQRDIVQSRLDNALKCAGDDHGDDGTLRWDEHSQSTDSLPRNMSEDALEGSDIYGVSEVFEEDCKEVQCIETNELRRSRNHKFNQANSFQLLSDAEKLQIPEVVELPKEALQQLGEELKPESITNTTTDNSVKLHPCESDPTADNAVKLYACDYDLSFDLGKPYPDESLALKRCIISSKDSALTRSRSCRASFMVIPNSWFADSENTNKTPPDEMFKCIPRRPEKVRRSLVLENGDCQNENISSDCSVDVVKRKATDNAEKENAINDMNCVTVTKEKTEEHDMDQPEENQQSITEEFAAIETVKDVGIDSALSTIESSSQWPIDFVKKQQEIIELWHACNVSIVHRTYFFLLFKGDPADSIYMEVEHRRLSFIKNSLIANPAAEGELSANIASSLKNLRHERDMLYRQMLKKLSLAERESLFTQWGIDLNSKQRRLQLSRRVWTQTDMEHVRESASLVAKVIQILERGQAIKEMFGLSFTLARRADRRSFSWVGSYS